MSDIKDYKIGNRQFSDMIPGEGLKAYIKRTDCIDTYDINIRDPKVSMESFNKWFTAIGIKTTNLKPILNIDI